MVGLVHEEVADDGRGFDPTTAPQGMGLISMRERVEALGGQQLTITSDGAGTQVRTELSAEQEAQA